MILFDNQSETPKRKEDEKVFWALNILESTAISDKDPLARKYALYMLGTSGDPSYTDIFIQSFYDPEKQYGTRQY